MKLSLAWIFDHIAHNQFDTVQHGLESTDFFDAIGQSIAEIERVQPIEYPLGNLFIAQVKAQQESKLQLVIPELSEHIELAGRTDLSIGQYCMVFKKPKGFAYVSLADLQGDRDDLLGALFVPEKDVAGAWKKAITPRDYILTFDNKSLTHRPDLWGHRGFAREVAALFDYALIPEEYICSAIPIRHFDHEAAAVAGNKFGLANQAPDTCTRIAGMSIAGIQVQGSLINMALRLAAVDARPINSIVDITNYVMFDMGQPMHAFDQEKLSGREITVTHAHTKQELELLDGTVCSLTESDTVVRDGKRVLGLAGIMGGKASAVSAETHEIFIESACFDANAIRVSAAHHKLRTQSSTRFEKSLDPHQNTTALLRFVKLMHDNDLACAPAQALLSLGKLAPDTLVTISNQYISDKIGVPVTVDTVQGLLEKLGFGVLTHETASGTTYTITVPSFRATKDITAAHDIVEEVARFIGFNKLPLQLPLLPAKPRDHSIIRIKRALKQQCAFDLSLHEVYNYALYDEDFLRKIQINPRTVYTIKNPVSQQAQRLVTSLIPHLFKNVLENSSQETQCGFFEIGTLWPVDHAGTVHEQSSLAGVWYDQHAIDFYEKKELLQQLCSSISLPVLWQEPTSELAPWYHPHQTAELVVGQKVIGHAGIAHPGILKHAFIFELDADFLCTYKPAIPVYHELSRFQSVTTDISMFVPAGVSIDLIEQTIAQVDARIYELYTVDYLEDQRAVTLRYRAVDQEKTLSKLEIEQLRASVEHAVVARGATIR